jgi:hypothetical protein
MPRFLSPEHRSQLGRRRRPRTVGSRPGQRRHQGQDYQRDDQVHFYFNGNEIVIYFILLYFDKHNIKGYLHITKWRAT